MSLMQSIEATEESRQTIRTILAGLYADIDADIERLMQRKADLRTEFEAIDRALLRQIEGEPLPAIVEAKKPEEAEEEKEEKADVEAAA